MDFKTCKSNKKLWKKSLEKNVFQLLLKNIEKLSKEW